MGEHDGVVSADIHGALRMENHGAQLDGILHLRKEYLERGPVE